MSLRGRIKLLYCSHFFVTTIVVDFFQVFTDENACELLIKNINHYKNKYNFIILGYAIMPSHFNWIIEVNKKFGTKSDIMRDIKKYSAWDIMEYLIKINYGYNNKITASAQSYSNQKRKFRMPRFDDEVIRNEKMLWCKLHYIHNYPVKAGLVRKSVDYKYSMVQEIMFIEINQYWN